MKPGRFLLTIIVLTAVAYYIGKADGFNAGVLSVHPATCPEQGAVATSSGMWIDVNYDSDTGMVTCKLR